MSNKESKMPIKKENHPDSSSSKEDKGFLNKYVFIILIFLIIYTALSFLYFINLLDRNKNELNQLNTSAINKMELRLKTISNELVETNSYLADLEARLELLSLSQTVEQGTYINKDYALAEIEHLLIIASNNLQLDNDVTTALAAMEAADTRLKRTR